MKVVAVIMAGGKGERFWPRSRRTLPKQFLSLTEDGKTMIQHTVERIKSLVSIQDVFIVTNKDYESLVKEQLSGLPAENILLEPAARNTAPCVGLAAAYIRKKYEDAVMLVLPSDHLIKFNGIFINTLKDAIQVAEEDTNMVTIGITPNYPETGYGYINFGDEKAGANNVYQVERFVEKPNLQRAKEYLESGKYLWNSGMFVWKTSTILAQFEKYLPEMYQGLLKIEEAIGSSQEVEVLEKEFSDFKSESIDYGIMEKASNIYTLPGSFGWDDVGSWLALERFNRTNEDGNVVSGNVISINTKNAIVQGSDKLIATIGVENLIIVDTEDAMLICAKDSTQDVKKVIENLKICNRNEYL
ncbi:mannose-1-phosphate guanylyltransferase/mannose-6-phosphate isomerase [Cellulosilyticum lentocellum]|uniref:mannose-1-phosphate guanylyltransferase n=1 Tax=Cellulosilyticum lentocellum (strain ATCC 49066 / DSM 5427 / NCIMB 11756 / RHM5) TaxID=642492 RepID=F2JIM7_CELLD|nr:mannose-1-phosphate guanylyltransferase/mannose-6-phosphate isomerase [Cellulosilyticum lentocellum]ADZ85497.1 Mannose-1-phosphate guanylyltransferase [Cellulosilyticum lentocellum DSM 5427]